VDAVGRGGGRWVVGWGGGVIGGWDVRGSMGWVLGAWRVRRVMSWAGWASFG
jgi:hypothetical protein